MSGEEINPDDFLSFWPTDLQTEVLGEERFLLMQARSLIYIDAYHALCEIVTGEKPTYPLPPEKQFREQFAAFLSKNRNTLFQRICIDFNYCEKRKAYGRSQRFVLLLMTALIFILDIKTGGLATATWLAMTSELDEFCGCSPN